MMHEHFLSRPDETVIDVHSVMCLFWDIEASSSALYQQIATRENCPVRADGWRRLQNWRLLLGEGPANHNVYVSEKLLRACREEAIRLGQLDPAVNDDPFHLMTRIMQLKFLQVMLITALRQQASLVAMVDVDKFGTSVALVTRLVLSSHAR